MPEGLLEIASRPGRLIKSRDGVWRPPSGWGDGGRVTTIRMVAVLGTMIPWGSDVLDVLDVLVVCQDGGVGEATRLSSPSVRMGGWESNQGTGKGARRPPGHQQGREGQGQGPGQGPGQGQEHMDANVENACALAQLSVAW